MPDFKIKKKQNKPLATSVYLCNEICIENRRETAANVGINDEHFSKMSSSVYIKKQKNDITFYDADVNKIARLPSSNNMQ